MHPSSLRILRRFLAILGLSIFLVACAGMPISSMFKLRNLNPLETNPADIRIAIITHKAVTFSDGATSLSIEFESEIAEHNFLNVYKASLETNPPVNILQEHRGDNENITLFYLAPDAAAGMQQTQNRIKTIRQADIEGSGSLSISINTACFQEAKPKSLSASIFAMFDKEQGYILMNRGLDLFEVAEREGQQEFWVEC